MSQIDPKMIQDNPKGSKQWPKPKKEGPKDIEEIQRSGGDLTRSEILEYQWVKSRLSIAVGDTRVHTWEGTPDSVGQSRVSLDWVWEGEEGADDDREVEGMPRDLGYIGVGYRRYVHGHMTLG